MNGRFIQGPLERKQYTVSFANWLDTGVIVLSGAISTLPSGLTVSTPTVTADALGLKFYVEGGTVNTVYLLALVMTASDTQKKEVVIRVDLREPA